MEIRQVPVSGPILDKVIELGNIYKKTLGFFPKGAYEQKAREGKILCALEDSNVLGYLLYDIKISSHIASITHLCVDQKYRKKGIAKKLLREMEYFLVNKVGGIRVRCRSDYKETKVWPKLGFKEIKKIAGRSKKGSELIVWRKDLPFLDLFRDSSMQEDLVIRACLDYNILADILKPFSPKNSGAHAIMEDWLDEYVNFFVSPELNIEVKRDERIERQTEFCMLAERFQLIDASINEFKESRKKLKKLFNNSDQDQSDLAHLAWCAASKIDYFISNDKKLHHKYEKIYSITGVRIVFPDSIVLMTDKYYRNAEYKSQRFGESELVIRRFDNTDFALIDTTIIKNAQEGSRRFSDNLRHLLAQSSKITTLLIINSNTVLGLVSWEINSDNKLIVHLARVIEGGNTARLSTGIINWMIMKCLECNISFTEIRDQYISRSIYKECLSFGFKDYDNVLYRWSLQGRLDISEIELQLKNMESGNNIINSYCKEIRNNLNRAASVNSVSRLLHIEKEIWPLKIKQLILPTYMVSIKPKYAMHLFDYEISSQDLFGGNYQLLLNAENVYYRSASGIKIEAPARIMWYISKGDGQYINCQSIRAVSYLDEVLIGNPKELFGFYKNLGIYKWKDLFQIIKGKQLKNIMAFVFSRSEILKNPIKLSEINQVWKDKFGKNFYIYQPLKITDTIFNRFYDEGMGL